ncbi:YecR family lipoprotein [Paraburkholderia sp. J8-2]|uniref:YecR family lipoprotein n=1 Tax=Paraburkholderia sp. J8-2 TaxID=2805440 RepID=UPI002AB67DBA|nr:YecR family lipoprotein [Paraburkholderia sp. J8-2]
MGKKIAMFLGAAILLGACAAPKEMVATGGSKADGTVRMSYEYGMFEVPEVNAAQGAAAATQRCAAWGYKEAEPFGGATKDCVESSGGSCDRWRVTVEYQCTGTP